jgi:predicted N-acetyltransferase YhbS
MKSEELVLIRPDPKEHVEAVLDLTAKTFGGHSGYWSWVDHCRKQYFHHSHYDWSGSTVGLRDGRVVTHWGVWDYQMRIGRARVRTGGIGAVSTHGHHRKQGLMARTATAGVEAMRRAGYDMTILFGISSFYHRFGYVRAWPAQTYIVRTDALPSARPAMTTRSFAPRHRDDLARLYNRAHARLTGTAVRPTYLRHGHGERWRAHLWPDEAGRALGYVVVGSWRGGFEVVEAVGEAEQVLRVVGRLARRRRAEKVHFPELHYDSALARRLRRGDCRLELEYQKNGGAMVQLLNLPAVLRKLAGELSDRLRRSALAGWRGRLVIAGPREKAALKIGGGKVTPAAAAPSKHVLRAGPEIAQFLIGTDEPGETAAAARTRLSGDAARLAKVLFPCQHPVLSRWDGF